MFVKRVQITMIMYLKSEAPTILIVMHQIHFYLSVKKRAIFKPDYYENGKNRRYKIGGNLRKHEQSRIDGQGHSCYIQAQSSSGAHIVAKLVNRVYQLTDAL